MSLYWLKFFFPTSSHLIVILRQVQELEEKEKKPKTTDFIFIGFGGGGKKDKHLQSFFLSFAEKMAKFMVKVCKSSFCAEKGKLLVFFQSLKVAMLIYCFRAGLHYLTKNLII